MEQHDKLTSYSHGAVAATSTDHNTEEECSASLITSKHSEPSSLDADSGSQDRRRYKRRQKRDPNRPERPLTGYVRFSRDRHKKYRHNQWTFAQLAKQIGEDWRDLDPDVKNEYLNIANEEWDVFRKAVEQDKLRRASEDYSPQVAAYHHALVSINGNALRRDGTTEPALAPNLSTFSVLSPLQRNSQTSPDSSMHVQSLTSPESATGSSLQYHHSTQTASPNLMAVPRQSHSHIPLSDIAPTFAWPNYSAEMGLATPQPTEEMQCYYPVIYAQNDGLFQQAVPHEMAMLPQRQQQNQCLGGNVPIHSEPSAAMNLMRGDASKLESRNVWDMSGSRILTLSPGTPDSTDCHTATAPHATSKLWDPK